MTLVGKIGASILLAIAAGTRNPEVCASLRNSQVKVTPEQLSESLKGAWYDSSMLCSATIPSKSQNRSTNSTKNRKVSYEDCTLSNRTASDSDCYPI